MSVYSSTSVGNRLVDSTSLVNGSPGYDAITSQLANELRSLALEHAERRGGATPVLMPHALGVLEAAEFASVYPEYRVIQLGSQRNVQSVWESHRHMAVNLCLDGVSRYAESITVIGDGLYQAATRDLRSVHVEVDDSNAVSLHASHQAQFEYVRVGSDADCLARQYSYEISGQGYSEFLSGLLYQQCSAGSKCRRQSDAMVFDLSMHPLSLTQASYAMQQAGAQVAEFFLPYSPNAFLEREGVLHEPSLVDYRLTESTFELQYREGCAGVCSYDLSLWMEWLKSTTARAADTGCKADYRLELLQHRGPFLYGRLVRVSPGIADGFETRHALEMPWASDSYVLKTIRLKSMRNDPALPSSWTDVHRVVPKDTVDKLFSFALGLEQSQFTPEAVLQRTTKIDSRVIVTGMSVRQRMPVDPDAARDIAVAVYAKAFVARYEMGRLGAELMASLRQVSAFATASRVSKVASIVVACAQVVQNWTVKLVCNLFKKAVSGFYAWFSGHGVMYVEPAFEPASRFVLMSDYTAWYVRLLGKKAFVGKGRSVTLPNVRGATLSVVSSPNLFYTEGVLPPKVDLSSFSMATGDLVDEIVDTAVDKPADEGPKELVAAAGAAHSVGRDPMNKFEMSVVLRKPEMPQGFFAAESFTRVPDPAVAINTVMDQVFPGLSQQPFFDDPLVVRTDPQERDLQADFLKLPLDDPTRHNAMEVFKSRISGYNVLREPPSLQKFLTALATRTLAAPSLRVASGETEDVLRTWSALKSTFFRPDCDELLEGFAHDPAGFEDELLRNWGQQARPENVRKVIKLLSECSFEDTKPWEFEMMLKSDAKPPMSSKPLTDVIAPQLIVMNDKLSNAMFSSIFRLMSRRFMSLLAPHVMLNLIKSTDDIRDHIAANHPWGDSEGLSYLENDFSKFDKSQNAFAYRLFCFVMEKLGFNQTLLDHWLDANTDCTLKSMQLGILLTSHYQNKSGGPATALMNGVLNMCAVAYCYNGTKIEYAVFMGDDSLVASRSVCASGDSLLQMAEVFNFEAKFFVLLFPYFVSNFVLFDDAGRRVLMIPDPIKRAQKYSVAVTARNPQWEDKFKGARDVLMPYRHERDLVSLADAVRERYSIGDNVELNVLFQGLATMSAGFDAYRSCYEADSVIVQV